MKLFVICLSAFFATGTTKTLDARGFPKKLDTTKVEKPFPVVKTKLEAKTAQPGDRAKNMFVLPPWTLRACPVLNYATYDFEQAKKLKKADSLCHLWQTQATLLEVQSEDFSNTVKGLKALIETHKTERKLDRDYIKDLTKRVNIEIAEKNKYKYRPDHKWLWISIGAAVAVIGVAFGTGVWVAKD